MFQNRKTSCLSWVTACYLILFFIHPTFSSTLVLCVGSDGHARIEWPHDNTCCPSVSLSPEHNHASDSEAGTSIGIARCCFDKTLSSGQHISHLRSGLRSVKPLLLNFAIFDLDSCGENFKQSLFSYSTINRFPHLEAELKSLRTIFLLI